MQQLQWRRPNELRRGVMHAMHLLGDAVHVMQQRYQPGRHDHVAAVQRWAFARDLPDGVLRNAASGKPTLTQIRAVLRNV